jgi:MscS family membrane protein
MENHFLELKEWVLVGGILLLMWSVLRSKKIFHRKILAKKMQGKQTPDIFALEIFSKIFTVIVLFIGFVSILQVFGLDVFPLLTLSGIGAAVVGFASKDVVANFFGGLMIYLTRPFGVKDQIEIPEKKIKGYVEEIGWYLTSIRDLHKKIIYVPNSLFSTEFLLNLSRRTHQCMEEKIRIRKPEEAEVIVKKVRALFKTHPWIDQNEPIEVFLSSLSPYGMELSIKAYLKTTSNETFLQLKEELLLEVHKIYSTVS